MLLRMWGFPLAATLVASVFAALLGRRWLERRRPALLLWLAALLMYAGASFALFLGTISGWTTAEYRAYWLLGAVLNVPYLAQGELYLLLRRRTVAHVLLLLLLFATAFALNRVRTAVPDVTALTRDLPVGREAWVNDPFVLDLARLYSFPAYFLLVGGALWSAWRMRGAAHLRDRFWGTLWIAAGATIVAAGSAFALRGLLAGFSLTLTAGIGSMFWGFVRASRSAAAAGPSTQTAASPP